MLTFCWLKLCIVNCFEWDFGAVLVEFSTSCRDVNDTMLLLLYDCSRLEASNQENSQLKQRMETLESDNRLNSLHAWFQDFFIKSMFCTNFCLCVSELSQAFSRWTCYPRPQQVPHVVVGRSLWLHTLCCCQFFLVSLGQLVDLLPCLSPSQEYQSLNTQWAYWTKNKVTLLSFVHKN